MDPTIEKAMVRLIPDLRGFALSLCRNRDRADDIVQETLTRAIASIGSFENGTNLEAWLFTILRNSFSNDYRRSKRTESDTDGRHAQSLAVLPDQEGWCITEDLRGGFAKLPSPYREALFLVGVSGLAYEEAATVVGCQTGTMKSRVSRARSMLSTLMFGNSRGRESSLDNRFAGESSAYWARRARRPAGHVSRGRPAPSSLQPRRKQQADPKSEPACATPAFVV